MANPRAVVDYEGVGVRRLTYLVDGSIGVYNSALAGGNAHVGKAVQITAANTVGLTVDGSDVEGRLERLHPDGMAVVQVEGGCSLPGGEAATLTAGSKIVGAAYPTALGGGGGGIRAVAPAVVAETAVARGRILDASVTTAVKVILD